MQAPRCAPGTPPAHGDPPSMGHRSSLSSGHNAWPGTAVIEPSSQVNHVRCPLPGSTDTPGARTPQEQHVLQTGRICPLWARRVGVLLEGSCSIPSRPAISRRALICAPEGLTELPPPHQAAQGGGSTTSKRISPWCCSLQPAEVCSPPPSTPQAQDDAGRPSLHLQFVPTCPARPASCTRVSAPGTSETHPREQPGATADLFHSHLDPPQAVTGSGAVPIPKCAVHVAYTWCL